MSQTNLNTLASRVEDANGPDEQLDFDIAEALGLQPTGWASRKGKCSTMWPRVTASLDAALTLVPEGADIRISTARYRKGWRAIVWTLEGNGKADCCSDAATPALALCAASLRAIAANG